jgi:hypothetical protein
VGLSELILTSESANRLEAVGARFEFENGASGENTEKVDLGLKQEAGVHGPIKEEAYSYARVELSVTDGAQLESGADST